MQLSVQHLSLDAANMTDLCCATAAAAAAGQLATIQSGVVAPGQQVPPVQGSGSPLSRVTRTSFDQPDSSLPPLHKSSHGTCLHTATTAPHHTCTVLCRQLQVLRHEAFAT